MKLSEILEQLAASEVSQLGYINSTDKLIDPDYYDTFINHINLALTALYKRFLIKEGSAVIELQPETYLYWLKSLYAQSNTDSTAAIKYLADDSADPFTDTVVKIERIYTDAGKELVINDLDNDLSLLTPTTTSIGVPEEIVDKDDSLPDDYKTDSLKVVYRSLHKKLDKVTEEFDPDDVEIELPEQYLNALLLFIASRAHNPIGMMQEFHSGNSYAQKYEIECQRLEADNHRIDNVSSSTRLLANGWL